MPIEFTVGQILSRSFDSFGRSFPFMLFISFLAVLPLILQSLFPLSAPLQMIGFAGYWFLSFLLQGVVTYGVFQTLTGRGAEFGESMRVALRRFFPILLVALTSFLLTAVGYLLLVIPGIVIQMMLWVAVPVTVVERGNVGHALQRSKDLTLGYRARIFAITIILGLISVATGGISGVLARMLISTHELVPGTPTYALLYLPLQVVFHGLVSTLGAVVVTVGYYTLRQEVEGISTVDLASVFD